MISKKKGWVINAVAGLLILAVGLIVGFTVFFAMRPHVKQTLDHNLMASLALRNQWVANKLDGANARLQIVATRPFLVGQVAAANAHKLASPFLLEKGLHSFLSMKISALVLYGRSGAVFAPAGHFMAHPAIVVAIKGDPGAFLLWNARRGYVFRAEIPLRAHGRIVGGLVGDVALPSLQPLVVGTRILGPSASLALCAPHGKRMACFPNTTNPMRAAPDMPRFYAHTPLPMSYALRGRSGLIVTQNYRGDHVVAAFMPVAHTGLGMVLSMDTRDLYASLRQDLYVVLPLLAGVLLLAMFALRWHLAPLVKGIVLAEHEAQEAVAHWRDSEARARAVFQNVDEGIATISETGIIETYNPAMERLFGYTEAEAIGQNVKFLMPEPYHSHHDDYLRHYRETGEAHVIGSGREVVGRHRDGREFPIDLRVSEFFLGGQRRFIGTIRDATSRKLAERQMEHVATHDALTDLPGRVLIQARIEQLTRRSERSGQLFAVMFLDLDRFKGINDSLGHEAGDRLLRMVADRLKTTLRDEDIVGRQSGDEFIVVASHLVAAMDAALIAEKLLATLSAPYTLGDKTISVGVSIGIALYPQDGRDAELLLKRSDMAMYEAKRAGGRSYRCFDDAMNTVASDQLLLVSQLHQALAQDEFVLSYRPWVAFSYGLVTAFPCQMAWHHRERGILSAPEFMPMAEEAGLALPLAEWTWRQICRDMHAWLEQGLSVPKVFVHLDSYQLRDERLRARWSVILLEAGLSPASFGLEVTEEDFMDDPEQMLGALAIWRSLGVAICLTDFGAGLSSLGYLKRLSPDALKLDASFTEDGLDGSEGAASVSAVVAMLHELKVQVIASSVDTLTQYEVLRLLGCDAHEGNRAGPLRIAPECGPYLLGLKPL